MATKGKQREGIPPHYTDGSAVVPSDTVVLPDGPCVGLVAQVAGNAAVDTPNNEVAYVAGTGNVVFDDAGNPDTITRTNGSWLDNGFRAGGLIVIIHQATSGRVG